MALIRMVGGSQIKEAELANDKVLLSFGRTRTGLNFASSSEKEGLNFLTSLVCIFWGSDSMRSKILVKSREHLVFLKGGS